MENSISDAARTAEYKTDISMKESSLSTKSLLRDSKNHSQKNVSKVNSSFSGVSSFECEINKGPKISGLQYPASDTENQKMNYGKTKEVSQQGQEDSEKGHLPIPTRSTELTTRDVKTQDQEVPMTEFGQIVLRPKGAKHAHTTPSEDGESTPSSPSEEKATDNIAFMITKTAVQVLSSGEVHDIVSRQGEDVQTVNIDAKKEMISQQEGTESEEPVVCLDKKPVIIIFDEPMDIRAAYKRLSTIFEECDEELERMMREEKIEEEEEEETGDPAVQNDTPQKFPKEGALGSPRAGQEAKSKLQPHFLSVETGVSGGQEVNKTEQIKFNPTDSPSSENQGDVTDDQFESPKKKFKFKFPKKQLAALTQAIRTGTKTGKKTLQVVVYEEEEEDGTLKQHKEAKRFEISRSPSEDTPKSLLRRPEHPSPESAAPVSRTDEIRKNTYRTLDSLEQTIKQLENTISEMSPKALVETSCSSHRDSVASSSHTAQEASPPSLLVLDEAPTALEPPSSIPSASRKVSWSDGKMKRASCFLKYAIITISKRCLVIDSLPFRWLVLFCCLFTMIPFSHTFPLAFKTTARCLTANRFLFLPLLLTGVGKTPRMLGQLFAVEVIALILTLKSV